MSATVSARLRELADTLEETHMYFDVGANGEAIEDGLGPTQAAMLARLEPPAKVDLLRWAADAAEELVYLEQAGGREAAALLARLAEIAGEPA